MTAVIIGNRGAGRAGGEGKLERCAEILESGGIEAEIWPTEYPEHATELAAKAGDGLIVAAGGDGTVNEIINGISAEATLGILPLGTANVLARELDLPMRLEAACKRIIRGQTIDIDVGVATDCESVERRFACMAGIGFDASVIGEVDPHMKRHLKTSAFTLTAFQVYFKSEMPKFELTHGDEVYTTQFAIVANTSHYGGDFKVIDEVSLTSGELSVVRVEKVGSLLRPDYLGRIFARQPLSGFSPTFSGAEVSARALGEKVPVQLDGEIWGCLPMSFRVDPSSLRVIR
ncbi:diacylglycerol/lipid kinase family protein [Rubrobacter aplysinae]|uniref:diacylglycerol/lipid kinase family protein n=1 Tax=Rubrobacter aplysinae TaxID=909625 RepID=UPI00064C294F|nr:diacylglycerol kinase family protein [Rubrobacter aplysinae]